MMGEPYIFNRRGKFWVRDVTHDGQLLTVDEALYKVRPDLAVKNPVRVLR